MEDSRKYLRILVKMDFSGKIFHFFWGWKTAFCHDEDDWRGYLGVKCNDSSCYVFNERNSLKPTQSHWRNSWSWITSACHEVTGETIPYMELFLGNSLQIAFEIITFIYFINFVIYTDWGNSCSEFRYIGATVCKINKKISLRKLSQN